MVRRSARREPKRRHVPARTSGAGRRRLRAALAAGVVALVGTAAWRASAAPALLPAGDYRLEMELAGRARLPAIGEVDTTLRSVSAAVLRWRDGRLHQEHRVCALWDDSGFPWGGLGFPEAFVAALAPARYPVELDEGYRADLGLEAIGVLPHAPALPQRASAAAVLDFEGDGRPGATLTLRVPFAPDAELWVVQRARAVLTGRVVARGVVEGSVEMVRFEQVVIGARPAFLRHTPSVRHDPARSRFRLAPAGAAGACAATPAADAGASGRAAAR